MLYGPCLRCYAPYAWVLRSNPTEWIIRRIARKRKLANPFISFETMIFFHIIYYPLYMLIMQAHPAFDRWSWLQSCMRNPVMHHDSGRTSQHWSTSQLWLNITTRFTCHDFSQRHESHHKSWLRSHITTPVVHPNFGRTSQLRFYIPTLLVHPDSSHISCLQS
jgi:hypothetical protein